MRTGRGSVLARKIKAGGELVRAIARLKRQGKKVVFTNGCFDLLHYGHVRYLEDAKRCGDILVVGVNSDSSVRKIKGPRRPVVNQHDRLRTLAGLESVDYVTLFSSRTPVGLIRSLRPDVLVKGADWDTGNIVGGEFVRGCGGRVMTVKLAPGRSTTNLIKEIVKKFRI